MYQSYRLDLESQLLYLISRSKSDRLCISKILQKKVLEYAHDRHVHEEVHRTYDLLRRFVFISRMKKLVHEYVLSCSFCQLSKASRQLSYEELHSIELSEKSLTKVSIDFIVALSKTTDNFNVLLTVIDRFFKFVLLIADRENFSISKWAKLYWNVAYRAWGISTKIISDRDLKFTFEFWKIIFQKCEVSLVIIIAYYSFLND